MPEPDLMSLLNFWEEQRNGALLPRCAGFTVERLRPWLAHLAWVEDQPKKGMILTVCGPALRDRFQGEVVGLALGEIKPSIAQGLQGSVERAFKTRRPLFSFHTAFLRAEHVGYHEICLPLNDATGVCSTVVVGIYRCASPTVDASAALEVTNQHLVRGSERLGISDPK